jgi:hypothetical protein
MSKSKMTNDKGQRPNPKSQNPSTKTQNPNFKVQADSELERDDMAEEGLRKVVETDRTESRGPGRLDARLKGVRRRKRARSGSGSDVLTHKMRLVKTVEERDAE